MTDRYGDHHRIVLPKRTIAELAGRDEREWDISPHSYIIYFFPNALFLHVGDHATAFVVHPRGTGESIVYGMTLIPELPASDSARAHWDTNVKISWEALMEDFAAAESTQAGLASGANRHLNFGASEFCAAAFHAWVEAALAARS